MFNLKKMGIKQRWVRMTIYLTVLIFGIVLPVGIIAWPRVIPGAWRAISESVTGKTDSAGPQEETTSAKKATGGEQSEPSAGGESDAETATTIPSDKAAQDLEALVAGGLGNVKASFYERYGEPTARFGDNTYTYQFNKDASVKVEFAPDVTDVSRAWELIVTLDKPASFENAKKMAATLVPEGATARKPYSPSGFREVQPYEHKLLGDLMPEDLFLGVGEDVPQGSFEVGFVYDIEPTEIVEIRVSTGQIHF